VDSFSGVAKKLRTVIFYNKQLKKCLLNHEISNGKLKFLHNVRCFIGTKYEAPKMLVRALLFAHDLYYHGSFTRVDICFHKEQRLPRSELHAAIDHWQRLVGGQKHGPQV
jgi:hypothetical protein